MYVVAGLVSVVVLILGIGATLPADHVASRSADYDQSPQAIWEAITDYESFPEWRSGVSTVERLPDRDGRPAWVEHGAFGPLPMAVDEARPPTRLVLRIADDTLPFGGTWTYEINRLNGNTSLTITERGTITNVVFRFMSRFVFGYTSTMETYLHDLETRFSEEVTVSGVSLTASSGDRTG